MTLWQSKYSITRGQANSTGMPPDPKLAFISINITISLSPTHLYSLSLLSATEHNYNCLPYCLSICLTSSLSNYQLSFLPPCLPSCPRTLQPAFIAALLPFCLPSCLSSVLPACLLVLSISSQPSFPPALLPAFFPACLPACLLSLPPAHLPPSLCCQSAWLPDCQAGLHVYQFKRCDNETNRLGWHNAFD